MKLWPKSPLGRAVVIALLALTATGVVGYGLFKIEIDRWLHQQAERSRLRDNPDPLLRSLARGEIRAGQPAEEFIVSHPPTSARRYARYEQFGYPNGVLVLSKDGRLVWAGCGRGADVVTFFQSISEREFLQYVADDLHHYLDESERERRLNKEERLWFCFEPDEAHAAVAGVAGYTSTAGWLRERAGLKQQVEVR